MLVDTHCHVGKRHYDAIEQIIKEMNGIMIVSGYDDETNLEVLELIKKYENVYGTLGIHPNEVDKMTSDSYKTIRENITNPKIVGIGETGLDYYWNPELKDKQKEVFEEQIKMAKEYNKPIVVHSRDAAEDTYEMIEKYPEISYVLHCYGGSLDMAKKFIKYNVMFGIGGVVTFKNNVKLQDVVKEIDTKYLLLETDSPYLAPEPYRGKQNQPLYVSLVAEKVAEIKGITVEEVIKTTGKNACLKFDLDHQL